METKLLTGRAQSTLLNTIHHADLFTLCDWLYEAGIQVDMILCDLPYGTTAIKEWDNVIAFEPMWQRFRRVIKPRGAIVLTASQPFTSRLVCSNLAWFRYDMIWHKTQATGHLNAQIAPLREHEEILVFGEGAVTYYPQMTKKKPENIRPSLTRANSDVYGRFDNNAPRLIPVDVSFPRSVVLISNPNHGEAGLHPTQKPVALFEYLIRTYTRAGEIVLDPCCGSGTTAIAARNTQRQYVCGDSSAKYVQVARNRLDAPFNLPLFAETA